MRISMSLAITLALTTLTPSCSSRGGGSGGGGASAGGQPGSAHTATPGSVAAGSATPGVAADGTLVPAPGADLTGPVAPPSPGEPRPARVVTPLDLGSDRAAIAIELPRPPRGGAASFTFGEERRGWVTRIPEANQLPSVAYGGGRIYVSGGFESVSFYGLDAATGRIEWASQALEDNGPTAPLYIARDADDDEGRVVFNTESCTLFVMEARTGKKLWFKYLGDPTLSQPAVSAGLVIAAHPGGSAHELTAYRIKNGNPVWTRGIDGELLAAPVIADGAVYASSVAGTTYRFDLKSGRKAWSRRLRATTAPWLVGDRLHVSRKVGGREVQAVISAATGEVIASHGSSDGKYLGDVPKDLADWKKVWAFEGSRPAVLHGVRYVAMGGRIEASDAASGELLWVRRYAPAEDQRSVGAVAVAGSQLVVATRKGEVFGLDIDTGYTVWAYATGAQIVAQPIVAKGWVYVSTTDGQVIALEVADASLDGWHMWGGDPHHNGLVTTTTPAPAAATTAAPAAAAAIVPAAVTTPASP